MSLIRRETIKALTIKAFEAYGQESQLNRMQIMIDMLDESSATEFEIGNAFKAHMQEGVFVPTIADILSRCGKGDEEDFLSRFRTQALSVYREKVVDDDVYTVKMILGAARCESCLTKDIQWLEKDALEAFKSVKAGLVQLKHNPALDRVRPIGNSGSYALLPEKSIERIVAELSPNHKSKIAFFVFGHAKKVDKRATYDVSLKYIEEGLDEACDILCEIADSGSVDTRRFFIGVLAAMVLESLNPGKSFEMSDEGKLVMFPTQKTADEEKTV